MHFSFKSLNELVPPYLSDYFVRNRIIGTYKIKERHSSAEPYGNAGKKTRSDVRVRFFFIINLHHQKKLHRFSLKRTFLDFILAIKFSY